MLRDRSTGIKRTAYKAIERKEKFKRGVMDRHDLMWRFSVFFL